MGTKAVTQPLFVATCFGDTPHLRWWDRPVQTGPPFMSLCGRLTMVPNHKALPRPKPGLGDSELGPWGALRLAPGAAASLGCRKTRWRPSHPRWPPGCQCPGPHTLSGCRSPSPHLQALVASMSQQSTEDSPFSREEQQNRYLSTWHIVDDPSASLALSQTP